MRKLVTGLALAALAVAPAAAQSANTLTVLKGLAPVARLLQNPAGQAALAANYTVTGDIQTGVLRRLTPLPFAAQRAQALSDVFITFGDLANLSDGLGSTLGSAYLARAHYKDRTHFSSVSPAVADAVAYALSVAETDSGAGKYLFANGTTDGKAPASDDALALLRADGGAPDPFGRSYGRPAGGPGADPFGDSRPFQTEPRNEPIYGLDYFNTPSDNGVYNRGPMMNLVESPSYPSGHTTYGYVGSLLLAVLVPDRYPEMVARAAEYGDDRILVGAHYAMDVIGGRTVASYDLAHLLANDPAYLNQSFKHAKPVADFQATVKQARADVTTVLEAACGEPVGLCAREDTGRFSDASRNAAFVAATLTYGLPVVHPETAEGAEDVGKLAPEAGNLLTAAFPALTLEQADQILTETEGPGGGFLDDGSAFGVYSRLNLYAAAERAQRLAPK